MEITDVFLKKSPRLDCIRAYHKGQTVVLNSAIALVVEGVIAVDLDKSGENLPITSRLVTAGQLLNPELLIDSESWKIRQFTTETSSATVAVLSVDVVRELYKESEKFRTAYVDALLSCQRQTEERLLAYCGLSGEQRLLWAFNQLEKVAPTLTNVTRERIRAMAGYGGGVITPLLTKMRKKGGLTAFMQQALTFKQARE